MLLNVLHFEPRRWNVPNWLQQAAVQIKEAVLLELNMVPRVRPVPARWLIKTTSGKIDRYSNKLKYLNHGVANDHP